MPPLATSFFIGPDGKLSRKVGMTWALAPDDTGVENHLPRLHSLLNFLNTIVSSFRETLCAFHITCVLRTVSSIVGGISV